MAAEKSLTAPRLALFYGAVFLQIGFLAPFWPVWLADRGLGPMEIGVVMASGIGLKIIFNPLFAHAADRRGLRRPIMIALATAAFGAFSLFALTDGFWPILLVTLLFFAVWSPIMPLGESLTMLSAGRADEGGELDYGRVRVWGSLTFMAAAVGGGYLFTGRPTGLIYGAVLVSIGLVVGATFLLPRTTAPPLTGTRFATLDVIRDRRFLLFICAAALIQSSHGVYYWFGTLNWKAAGYSEDVIGWLWAEGVAAEIVLFAFGAKLIGRLGPAKLIALGGLAGALRWSVTGISDALPVLVAVQLLHAFTFGATHLGAIYFIARRVPQALSASAQGLYSAIVMGLALGLSALVSGKLFGLYGAGAYYAMAVLAAAGGVAALMLAKRH